MKQLFKKSQKLKFFGTAGESTFLAEGTRIQLSTPIFHYLTRKKITLPSFGEIL